MKNNQKDLETVTEQLSEYLERDITSDTLSDIKQKVQDKSRSAFCATTTTDAVVTCHIFTIGLVPFKNSSVDISGPTTAMIKHRL